MAEVTAEKPVKVKPSRGRVRRVAKWVGLVVCVLVIAGYFVSSRHGFRVEYREHSGRVWSVTVVSRWTQVGRYEPGWAYLFVPNPPSPFSSDALGPPLTWTWLRGENYSRYSFEWNASPLDAPDSDVWSWRSSLPLWPCAVLAAIAGVLLVRSIARGGRRGCCARCGYSLKGLVAARCPECGAGVGGAVG